jgi:hypothetical protein
MKTLRRLTIVIVLTCLICNAVSFGEEIDKAKKELEFEISIDKYSPPRRIRPVSPARYRNIGYGDKTEVGEIDKSEIIKPTHVAHMGQSEQLFSPSYLEPDALLTTPSGKEMSDLQKEFLKQGKACAANYSSKYQNNLLRENRFHGGRLYAVSEEDAKKMARAFIESWHNNMGAEVEKFLKKKKGFESKAVELRKRYKEKVKEADKFRNTLKEKSSKGIYSFDRNGIYTSKAREMARETARGLYPKLNAANIEIEVIKARLSAATVYQARENGNPAVQAKLEEIMCEQTIELAGALERQEGIANLLQQEEEILRLYAQIKEADLRRGHLSGPANIAESNLKRATEEFEKIDSSDPSVGGNKVTIYPVEL